MLMKAGTNNEKKVMMAKSRKDGEVVEYIFLIIILCTSRSHDMTHERYGVRGVEGKIVREELEAN